LSDKLHELEGDLVEARRALNELFTVISKVINLLGKAQKGLKNLEQELKQEGGNK